LLLRLIGDILDISRLETDKLRFSFEECEIVGLCQKVLTTTSYAKKENVEYVFHPIVDSFVIETDVQRLQQILINLLSNANKFTTEGQITLEFRIDEKKQFVEFSVTDTGCGIPLEKQEKVFERFEKLNEYAQGTGLGLAICRITVEKLGGKIGVDKEYKAGTRFVFTHPVRQKR
jgi:signal transduction histidine kinase